jgi:hypothetical protein
VKPVELVDRYARACEAIYPLRQFPSTTSAPRSDTLSCFQEKNSAPTPHLNAGPKNVHFRQKYGAQWFGMWCVGFGVDILLNNANGLAK